MSNKRPPLDVISATTLVAASMIGVGVYTTSGFTLAALGTPERVIAAWMVGGLLAICGAMGYASLASRFSESGGEYLFLSKTLHPAAGLMAGWVSLLAGFTGAIAIAALGLETYLRPLLFDSVEDRFNGEIAIPVVLLAAILHTIGVRGAARVQDWMVGLKFLLLIAFIIFALAMINSWPGLTPATGTAANPTETLPLAVPALDWLVFANQLVWISFSYAGFNAAIYIASEIRDAERNVPRAMIGGTILVTLVYVVLNAIFVFSAPIATITNDANIAQIAATAANAIGGDSLANAVRIVIVISLFTSVSALTMTGPRVYAKMADDGFFPRWFRFNEQAPTIAIWFQATIAIVAISLATLKDLLGYLGLTLSVCSALTVAMLFVIRRHDSQVKLLLGGVPAISYVLGTLFLAALYGVGEPKQAAAALITVVLGGLLYRWIGQRKSQRPPENPSENASGGQNVV
ncbi:MAG: amino acid permease [Rubripirellula sp.]|nr:amino acid permease [Rubripirellula sp.]